MLVGFLEDQRLDKGKTFSDLLSFNVPAQNSVVWHLWNIWVDFAWLFPWA